MERRVLGRPQIILLAGDALTLALVTIYGFATHRTLATAGARLLTTFLPLLASWLLVAPHLAAFDPQIAARPQALWRPFWAMILAAPLAAFLRAVWLRQNVQPLFVVILGGVSALALLAWRAVYWVVSARRGVSRG